MEATPEQLSELSMGGKPRIAAARPPVPFGIMGPHQCGAYYPCICARCVQNAIAASDKALQPTARAIPRSLDRSEIERRCLGAPLPADATEAQRAYRERTIDGYVASYKGYNDDDERRYVDHSPKHRRAHALLMSLLTTMQRATWDSHRAFWTFGSDGHWWLVGWNGASDGDGAAAPYQLSTPGLIPRQVPGVPTCIHVTGVCAYDSIVAKKLAIENDANSLHRLLCGFRWDARGVRRNGDDAVAF